MFFRNIKINAFWLFTSYPNPSISFAASHSSIELIDTYTAAYENNILTKYPYYTQCIIAANTYNKITHDVVSFQDSAILLAHQSVPPIIVEKVAMI